MNNKVCHSVSRSFLKTGAGAWKRVCSKFISSDVSVFLGIAK